MVEWMMWQDVEVFFFSIAGIVFSKRGSGVNLAKTSLLEVKIASFWNPFAATDTWHQHRNTEKWLLSLI